MKAKRYVRLVHVRICCIPPSSDENASSGFFWPMPTTSTVPPSTTNSTLTALWDNGVCVTLCSCTTKLTINGTWYQYTPIHATYQYVLPSHVDLTTQGGLFPYRGVQAVGRNVAVSLRIL